MVLDAPVSDGRLPHMDSVFTHVHVVHSSGQSELFTYVQQRLPVIRNGASLSDEEDGGRDHCNRDDLDFHGFSASPVREHEPILFTMSATL